METKEFLTKFQNDLEKKKLQANPSLNCFAGLFSKRMAQGGLSVKMKELVAIRMAVAKQCEPCINLHVKKCLDTGASREEVLKVAGVAVKMGGGPAYTHVPMVMESLDDLES